MVKKLTFEDSSVQAYLNIFQNIINRMSNNSTNCKAWAIAVISVLFVFNKESNLKAMIFIILFPIILLFILDGGYIGLEKMFRKQYNEFVKKVMTNKALTEDLFGIKTYNNYREHLSSIYEGIRSLSVWPFYFTILILLLIAYNIL